MSYSLKTINDLKKGDKVRVCYRIPAGIGKEKYISGVIESLCRIDNNVLDIAVSFTQKQSKKPTTVTFFHSQVIKVYVEDEVDFDLGI